MNLIINQKLYGISLLVLILSIPTTVIADDSNKWYVKPYIGMSQLSDTTGDTIGVGSLDGSADIDLDTGFTAGFSIGYQYTPRLAAELAWEYRSNDSEVTLPDNERFSSGNYASNIFHINGIYSFSPNKKLSPYIGAGISWVQEIDIDLEKNGSEQSFSADGDLGYQLFAGLDYQINSSWSLNSEVRYGYISNIDLEGENVTGTIEELDYKPTTLQFGVKYKF